MSIVPSQKPTREWLWLALALLVVGGITIPLWQWAAPPENSPEYWSTRWTTARVAKLLLGPEQIACYFCFVWAGLMLLSRYREVHRQRQAFGLDLLPTEEGSRILPEDARPIARKVAATSANITLGGGTLNLGGTVTYSATNNPNGATISGADAGDRAWDRAASVVY